MIYGDFYKFMGHRNEIHRIIDIFEDIGFDYFVNVDIYIINLHSILKRNDVVVIKDVERNNIHCLLYFGKIMNVVDKVEKLIDGLKSDKCYKCVLELSDVIELIDSSYYKKIKQVIEDNIYVIKSVLDYYLKNNLKALRKELWSLLKLFGFLGIRKDLINLDEYVNAVDGVFFRDRDKNKFIELYIKIGLDRNKILMLIRDKLIENNMKDSEYVKRIDEII